MHSLLDETIAAPASASGGGERAIIRLSGPFCQEVVSQLFVPDDPAAWNAPRRPTRHTGEVHLPDFPIPIPVAVSLWTTVRSYTGQPMAELHLIGSPPIVDALLEALYRSGARPARAGEFTQRAFLSGRLDLMQAEAVLGVIDADDPATLRQALRQLEGGISTRILECRETLLLHLADLEAGLDFVEEDIDFVSRDDFRQRLDAALELIESLLSRTTSRMRSEGRPRVVLAGLPNAGKSTLLNALANRDSAIVSPQAGTTRDVITAPVCCDGVWIELTDTAGIEETVDPILGIAQTMGRDEVDRCDLLLWCRASDLSPVELQAEFPIRQRLQRPAAGIIDVFTKGDLRPTTDEPSNGQQPDDRPVDRPVVEGSSRVTVSATTGAGLARLKSLIASHLDRADTAKGELLASSSARCRESLQRAGESLQRARELLDSPFGDEVVSMELRTGLDALGAIAGTIYTDDILDRIFSRFCIGK
ncbi:MAG: tRNA modification GTPase [Planctomycetaceae bacterium]